MAPGKRKNYTILKYRDIYYTMIKVSIHQERYKNPEHVFSRKQSCKIFKVKTDWTERKKIDNFTIKYPLMIKPLKK